MAVQYHTSKRAKKTVSLGNVEFKFNNEQGYFVEANYNRAIAMKFPELTDVLKDVADYGKKQMENMFREIDERENEQTSPSTTEPAGEVGSDIKT